MPRQKPSAPQRLGQDERQRQNWRMGEAAEAEERRPLIVFDDDDDSYNSEEDLVCFKLLIFHWNLLGSLE